MAGAVTNADFSPSWPAGNVTDDFFYDSTEVPTLYPSGARIAYAVLLIVLALTGTGANLLVLAVMACTRKSRVSVISSGFLLNLVASDLAVNCVLVPLALHGALDEDARYDKVCI